MAVPKRFPDVVGLTVRQAAVAYAEAGFTVGPTVSGKNPGYLLGNRWQDKTSSNPSTVDGWFDGRGRDDWNPQRAQEEPTSVFLHCGPSGVVVFDLDNPEGLPDDLREVFEAHPTARQVSRRDGSRYHVVYATEPDEFGNGRGSLPKGWGDVRGGNGVIILEPSPHPKPEGTYEWVRHDMAPLPGVLADRLRERAVADFDAVRSSLGDPIPLGERDDTVLRYACRLRGLSLDREEALALLRLRAQDCDNSDGRVDERFIRAKLDNAWKYPPGMASVRAAEGRTGSVEGEDTFWESRAVLGHLRAFARARRTSPWAVLVLTLARVVCATPHRVCLPPTVGSRASLNSFVALVGPSGSGKSSARSVSRDALRIENEPDTVPLGSGEGVSACYVQFVPKSGKGEDAVPAHYEQYNFAAFFEAEEIGTLGAIKGRGGSTLGDTLRKAWDGKTLGFANRAADTRLIVEEHRYRMCLWVGVQPDAANVLLDDSGVGTPQRFVWAAVTDPGRPEERTEAPDPIWWTLPPLPDDGGAVFADEEEWAYDMPLCDSAVDAIHEARDRALLGTEGLDSHLLLCRTKVAAALALLDRRWSVSEEDWTLSGTIMAHSNGVRDGLVRHLRVSAARENESRGYARAAQEVIIAERTNEHQVKRVAEKIYKYLRDGSLTRRELNQRLAGRDKPWLADALEHLGDLIESKAARGLDNSEVVSWCLRDPGSDGRL